METENRRDNDPEGIATSIAESGSSDVELREGGIFLSRQAVIDLAHFFRDHEGVVNNTNGANRAAYLGSWERREFIPNFPIATDTLRKCLQRAGDPSVEQFFKILVRISTKEVPSIKELLGIVVDPVLPGVPE